MMIDLYKHLPKGPHEEKRSFRALPVIAAVFIMLSQFAFPASLFPALTPENSLADPANVHPVFMANRWDYCQNRLYITGDFAAEREKHPAGNHFRDGRTSAETAIKKTPEQNGYNVATKRAACPFIIPIVLCIAAERLLRRHGPSRTAGAQKATALQQDQQYVQPKDDTAKNDQNDPPMQGRLSFAVLERPGRVNYSRSGKSFLHTSPRISSNT